MTRHDVTAFISPSPPTKRSEWGHGDRLRLHAATTHSGCDTPLAFAHADVGHVTWREWDHTSLSCAAVVDLGGSHHTRPQSRAAELRGAALGALTRQQDETLRAATRDETFTAIHVDVETHTRRRRAKARPRIRPREAAGRRAPHQGENDQPKHTRGPTPTLPKRD